jgi:hypothetical protein
MEKDLALAEGLKLARELRNRGYDVFLTRDNDSFHPLAPAGLYRARQEGGSFQSPCTPIPIPIPKPPAPRFYTSMTAAPTAKLRRWRGAKINPT